MSIVAVATPETPALERQGTSLVKSVEALVVTDAATFEQAADILKSATAYIARVGEVLDPIVDAAHKAHKIAVQQRDGLLKPAQEAKKTLGRRMADYEAEVTRRRREAEEAAQRERDRLEREAAAAAEAERVRLQAEADQRALDAAAAAEAAGDTELADRLIAAPPVVAAPPPRPIFTPPVAVPRAPVATGISFRDNYHAEVTDLLALVRAIAAGSQPITLVLPNQVALNGLARSLKQAMAVPGVRAVNDRTTSAKA